jgi:ankyrin repeat protein
MVQRQIFDSGQGVDTLTLRDTAMRSHSRPLRMRRLLRCDILGLRFAVLGFACLFAFAPSSSIAQGVELSVNARLLAAARNDDAAGIDRALRDGAAIDSRNRLGESALLIVLKRHRPDLALRLIDAGANVNQPAINGVTPLMAAAFEGNTDVARVMLDKGADTAALDRLQKNAMTYAAGEGRTDVVRLLIASGVDPNAVYRNDLTALMWAAGNGHTETVEALLAAGAKRDLRDNRGKSALDMAREEGHATTAGVLGRAGDAR